MTASPTVHTAVGAEHQQRLAALRAYLTDNALAAIVVTSPETIFYLTGYSSTAYYMPRALIVTHVTVGAVVCDVEDGPLYSNNVVAHHYSWSLRRDPASALAAALIALVPAGHTCGLQAGSNFSTIFTPDVYALLVEHCGRVVRGVQIDHLRRVKTPSELVNSRRAGALAVTGLRRGLDALDAGVTELQVSTEMLVGMVERGGEVPASYPYTYFGRRSWRRMELPSHRALQKDEPYYLECGATAGRYGASMLRTGYAGTAPAELRFIHAAAVSAFEAMLEEVRPGVPAGRIDDVATSELQRHGLADTRINKVAYSIGVGFPPGWGESTVFDLHPANDQRVEEGMVFHLVSLLMSEAYGAVGISETVEVTQAGARSLTECPRNLTESHL